MNDLTFLDENLTSEHGAGDAILKAVLPGGKVIHISDAVSPFKFLDTCPLLYHAFEYNSQSRLQASIDASSETAVISLARYCYTGSYLAAEPDGESILLLQHAETYKIAEDFDLPTLQIMAHGNFECQIEYACCLPDPPKDLLDTIRFVYRHFASDEARRKHNLVDTLLNYCVAVYLYHKLGDNLDFLTAIHEISAFRQDLCRTNIARNFEDDCAADIIRLPSGPAVSSNVPTLLASRELPEEMLYSLPRAPVTTGHSKLSPQDIQEKMNRITLSYRRGVLGMQTFRQGIPDRSKHCVSPSALTGALEKHNATSPDTEDDDVDRTENTLRRYKRARIEETTALLEGWPLASESDITEQKSVPVKLDEDSYWAGAFGQTKEEFQPLPASYSNYSRLYDTRPKPDPEAHSSLSSPFDHKDDSLRLSQLADSSSVPADTKPANTLPPLVSHKRHNLDSSGAAISSTEYLMTLSPFVRHKRNDLRPSHPASSSAESHTTLPLRPRDLEISSPALAADSASEDEDFILIQRAHADANPAPHSPMSSPELVCVEAVIKAEVEERGSDEEWTLLDDMKQT